MPPRMHDLLANEKEVLVEETMIEAFKIRYHKNRDVMNHMFERITGREYLVDSQEE